MSSARWSFEATREAPGKGRRAIREFLASVQPTRRALDSIALCLTEAVTNVVVHAYRDGAPPRRVELEAEIDGYSLSIRVCDHGHGLEPRLDSPGLGLGLPLISQMSSSSQIVTGKSGGTEIVMRFDLREQEGS